MIHPKRLAHGDKIAIVSLSWGGLGDKNLIHKYDIARERLKNEFGLEAFAMPNSLKGTEFIAKHPELRAKDLMDAFTDKTISAIFCAIGGDDSIRILPYIDYEAIKNNPKIFMGYSDNTVSHLIMYKAGLVSFYGPMIMSEFGEYGSMFEYTKTAVSQMLFEDTKGYQIESSKEWSDDFVPWEEGNRQIARKLKPDEHGYEILQGTGKSSGHLLGGCLDVFMMYVETEIWPSLEAWRDAILFIETSEDKPSPEFVKWTLRNFAAQGILKVIRGILVGKPQEEVYYDEYKSAILQVVKEEEHLDNLPIFYNVNFGHAVPIGIIPYGITVEIDCEEKTITLLENVTE